MRLPKELLELVAIATLFVVIGIATLCSTGCAEQTDPLDRQMRNAIAAENWAMCKMAYKNANKYTTTRHPHTLYKKHTTLDIADDLFINNCHMVLRQYWISQ